jgi:hypothetical protein
MTKEQLLSARDYFDEITTPAYEQFMDTPSTFLSVYTLSYGLYHLSEWLYFYKPTELQAKYGNNITSAGKLWADVVEKQVPDSGLIRDLNNAAKHVQLKIGKAPPSTAMHHSANTHIIFSTTGNEPRDGTVKLHEGARQVLLDTVATDVYEFWKKLVDEFYPVAAPVVTVASAGPTANS